MNTHTVNKNGNQLAYLNSSLLVTGSKALPKVINELKNLGYTIKEIKH